MLLIIPKLYQLKGPFGVLFPYRNSVSEFGHAISLWGYFVTAPCDLAVVSAGEANEQEYPPCQLTVMINTITLASIESSHFFHA